MPSPSDTNPAADVAILVSFEYETPATRVLYARWESDVIHDGETYLATPKMAAVLPKRDGTIRTEVAEVQMESHLHPIPAMRTTFPPVTVTVAEKVPGVDASYYILHKGIISKVEHNQRGNPSVARVFVPGPKGMLDGGVSIELGQFCPWIFGQRPCGYDREGTKKITTITAIDGCRLTVSPAIPFLPVRYRAGGVRYRGFEVSIYAQESATLLYLTMPAPLHWLNKSVDVMHGCDKTPGNCEDLGQLDMFSGAGVALPVKDVRIYP